VQEIAVSNNLAGFYRANYRIEFNNAFLTSIYNLKF